MKSEFDSDGADPRGRALRDLLVDRVEHLEATPRVRMTRRAAIVSIAAFTVAGGLAGGAVSAVALTADASDATLVDVDASVQASIVGDAELLGTPFTYVGSGTTVLELGAPPNGAEEFIYSLRCLEAATFVTTFDDDPSSRFTTTCDDEAAASSSGGGGTRQSVSGQTRHSLTVESSARYSVWGSWAAKPVRPAPSAAQTAALADGSVTQEEYRSAYDRFSACMSEAGFPLAFVDEDKTVIQYSTTQEAETDGASPRCYTREFEQVDAAWQLANEDTSESARFLGECLAARGITPAATMAEKIAQLDAAGISPLDC